MLALIGHEVTTIFTIIFIMNVRFAAFEGACRVWMSSRFWAISSVCGSESFESIADFWACRVSGTLLYFGEHHVLSYLLQLQHCVICVKSLFWDISSICIIESFT